MHSDKKDLTGEESVQEPGATVKELFGRIKQCVAAGDFVTAESLREEMMATDTMALSESIASAEIIEEAKLASIDDEHLQLWDELYTTLSPEERSVLFYSLVEKTLPPKTVVSRQGHLSDNLVFVERGHLVAIFTKEKENHLVLNIGPGEFFGEDTFFGMSVSTTSIVAQSEVVIKILTKDHIREWEEKAPGLYVKIESFCRKHSKYIEAYERKRQEKSRFQRHSVHGLVSADILNASMKQSGQHFKAAIGDISRGGVSFFIKSSRQASARALLARPLKMDFSIEENAHPVEFTAMGNVVRVEFHMENDYSVHVQFNSPLEEGKLENL